MSGTERPPRWTESELAAQCETARRGFILERAEEGTERYRAIFEEVEPSVRRLFETSRELREFTGAVLQRDPGLVHVARYLASPPVSEDDLRTLGGRLGRKPDPEAATRIVKLIRHVLDPKRYPWLNEQRRPRRTEVDTAIAWTTSIWAIEKTRTARRVESSRRQEEAIESILRTAKFNRKEKLGTLIALDDLPRGQFTREIILAGSKCDVAVRLHDGRLLALEAKVSNSELNSIKRLIRETGGKARVWDRAFGEQVVTGAVLSGVFKLRHLVEAQDKHDVAIFWEHDLSPLSEFVQRARER